MRYAYQDFTGERPGLQDDKLPENGASEAINCRFVSGNLESWLDYLDTAGIVKVGAINSIFLLEGGFWLHWLQSEIGSYATNVDVALGPLPGDEDEYFIFTGTDAPRWSNKPLATDEPPPMGVNVSEYPYISYLLGIPAPTDAPVLTVSQSTSGSNVAFDNPGAETGIVGWTVDAGDLAVHANGDNALDAYEGTHYFYGGDLADPTIAHQEFAVPSNTGSLTLTWRQATGPNGSTGFMGLEFYDSVPALIDSFYADDIAPGTPMTWTTRSFSRDIPATAETVRLVMHYTAGTPGIENDCYIDGIELSLSAVSLNYDVGDLSDWTIETGHATKATITTDAVNGWPTPSYHFKSEDSYAASMYQNLGIEDTPQVDIEFEFQCIDTDELELSVIVGASATGVGQSIKFGGKHGKVILCDESSWKTGPSVRTELYADPADYFEAGRFRAVLSYQKSGSSKMAVTLTTYKMPSGEQIFTASTVVTIYGDYLSFKGWSNDSDDANGILDNVKIAVAAPVLTANGQVVLTNYVKTWVNSIGQEGPPSPVSRDIQLGTDTVVTITSTEAPPAGYNITRERFYRAITDATGLTDYYEVGEVTLPAVGDPDYPNVTFVDNQSDSDLANAQILETVDWDLPPAEGEGALNLGNGITCMFAGKEWAPSVINRSHAYPQAYRHQLESKIVGQGQIATAAVVWTKTRPYMMIGSDPSRISEVRFGEHAYGLASKRSIASIANYGVIGACAVGLVAVTGPRRAEVVTKPWFQQREWLALNPSSIVGIAHDDRYFFSWKVDDTNKGAYLFDPSQGGNGLTQLDQYFKAAWTDPLTDTLYFVDENDALIQWEGSTTKLTRTWLSRLEIPKYPVNFAYCQVHAKDFADLTLRLYEGDTLYYTRTVTSNRMFVVGMREVERFRLRLSGTSVVESVQIAESEEEIT